MTLRPARPRRPGEPALEWRLTPEERRWLDREEADWRGNPWNSFKPTQRAQVAAAPSATPCPGLPPPRPAPPRPRLPLEPRAVPRASVPNRTLTFPLLASPYACGPAPSDPPAAPRVGQHRQRSAHPFGRTHGLGRLHDGLPSGAGEPGKTLTLTITSPTRAPPTCSQTQRRAQSRRRSRTRLLETDAVTNQRLPSPLVGGLGRG